MYKHAKLEKPGDVLRRKFDDKPSRSRTFERRHWREETMGPQRRPLCVERKAHSLRAAIGRFDRIISEDANAKRGLFYTNLVGTESGRAPLSTNFGVLSENIIEVTWIISEVMEAKVKPKTRGIPGSLASEDQPSPAVEEPEIQITAAVNKRAIPVFKAIFPGNNTEGRSKAIDWVDFVIAMAGEENGFAARHSGGDSAYTFKLNE
ncbi:hypothetical protein DL98DRAFT_614243 [Cadophora sp. DSE1049]|nr:hypothetical protein DL98DRAFT_614243 [Cadophora sp. DSE1049]